MIRSIQELRALRRGTSFKPYAVGEAGTANAQLVAGSTKSTHGRTIQLVHLIFRCGGACAICVTATDSVFAISQTAES
jgi:hypothetical protein